MEAEQHRKSIELAYQISTMTQIPDDLLCELLQVDFVRVLEVLLVLRQSPNPIKAPANFIRSALRYGWKPGGKAAARPQKNNGSGQPPSRYDSFYQLYEG